MTQQEILHEIGRLPLDEQLEIIEKVAHNARQQNGHSVPPKKAIRGVPVEQAIGIAKPKDGPPPNDEEVKQILMDRLMEKYG